MTPLMTRHNKTVGLQLPRIGCPCNMLSVFCLLGTGLVLSPPVHATEALLPNLTCVTTDKLSETLTVFTAGKTSMALVLPIQRQGRRVKTLNVHLHAVWLLDPSRQAEVIASDMQQKCLVGIKSSGDIEDIIN